MKLYLSALLRCRTPGCAAHNLMLHPSVEEGEIDDADFSPDLMRSAVTTFGYDQILRVAAEAGVDDVELPSELPPLWANDAALLRAIHEVLLNREIKTGRLVCEVCGAAYPVERGMACMDAPKMPAQE